MTQEKTGKLKIPVTIKQLILKFKKSIHQKPPGPDVLKTSFNQHFKELNTDLDRKKE